MSEGKRYYWLKLKDDFFTSKRIKKLRRMAGGDTYTIIYLKMQLMAMKSDGILKYTGLEAGPAEELALDLDEEVDNVRVTLAYLTSVGLVETSDNVKFFFPYAVENTGSEGASAKRVREHRERERASQSDSKALHCNTGVTQVKQICNGEKEIEKEIEIELECVGPAAHAHTGAIAVDDEKTAPAGRGEYGNILISDEQYGALRAEYGALADRMIDEMDSYLQTGGKPYKDTFAALKRWCKREQKKPQSKRVDRETPSGNDFLKDAMDKPRRLKKKGG